MSKSTAFASEQSLTLRMGSSKSFGTTVKRFDPNQDFKELFSREPGPGSYSIMSTTADSVISGSATLNPLNTFNAQGTGNGFVSKSDRFAIAGLLQNNDPKINVAPG